MIDRNFSRSTAPTTTPTPVAHLATRLRRGIGGAILAIVVITVAARIAVAVPLSPVPVTGQTLAVLLAGAMLGRLFGPLAVALYLLAGCVGLPVFADGAAGLEHLTGPTGGYLVGFVVGAWLAGWAANRDRHMPMGWRRIGHLLAAMVAAHAVILLLGGGRLAMFLGPQAAWTRGIAPFLIGAILKSLIAVPIVQWLRPTRT